MFELFSTSGEDSGVGALKNKLLLSLLHKDVVRIPPPVVVPYIFTHASVQHNLTQ